MTLPELQVSYVDLGGLRGFDEFERGLKWTFGFSDEEARVASSPFHSLPATMLLVISPVYRKPTRLVTVYKDGCAPLLVPDDSLADFAARGWSPSIEDCERLTDHAEVPGLFFCACTHVMYNLPNCPLLTGGGPCECDLPRCSSCGYTAHDAAFQGDHAKFCGGTIPAPSIGPFPAEPAPGSPDAVAQAAETIRRLS